jgi:hypothetical protein
MKTWLVRHKPKGLVPLLVALGVALAGVTAMGQGGWAFMPNGTIRYGGGMSGPGLVPYGSLNSLPNAARAYGVGGHPYYWYGGGWYAPAYYGANLYYYPVAQPVQGIVGSVPLPYDTVQTGNGVYLVHNGVYYQPFSYLGTVWYRVVVP